MSTVRSAVGSRRFGRSLALLVLAAICATSHSLRAGDTTDGKSTPDDGKSAAPATTEETPEDYKNWVELGIGGVAISGNSAQFKQDHGISGDVFGGISDLHYEQAVDKNTQFTVDGHGIFDNNDYDVKMELSRTGVGYIRAGYTAFREWYDGDGGFFPPRGGTFFPPQDKELHIDRSEEWVELGLRMPNWPEMTLRYSHEDREGQKDSTIWGDTAVTGIAVNPTRRIVPAFSDIDETRDILSFDATKTFGNTDVS